MITASYDPNRNEKPLLKPGFYAARTAAKKNIIAATKLKDFIEDGECIVREKARLRSVL
jgi:hypothetical protein